MEADDLAVAVRAALAGAGTVREVKMFGGIGFMLNGNLLAGASKRGLLVRVGKDLEAEALKRSGARPMEMRGRKMDGYVYVDPPALTARAVKAWIEMASAFVRTLPKKPASAKRAAAKAKPKAKRR
jgi:TfoX/Sxy family transcriptional regulator of competence genes